MERSEAGAEEGISGDKTEGDRDTRYKGGRELWEARKNGGEEIMRGERNERDHGQGEVTQGRRRQTFADEVDLEVEDLEVWKLGELSRNLSELVGEERELLQVGEAGDAGGKGGDLVVIEVELSQGGKIN